MATDSYKLGPGVLMLGTDPDDLSFEQQMTNTRLEPSENVDAGETFNLLDGGEVTDDDNVTYTYVLAGTALQDLNVDGFTDYCYANKGTNVAFKFIPNTARGATVGVTGICRIAPILIGGDVKVRNTAPWSFVVVGDVDWTPDST